MLRSLLIFAVAVVASASLGGCKEEVRRYVKNIGDGTATPTMNTLDVNTFISDSGYTRYFITAPRWSMYEDAPEPFWLFPDGIELEQYDRSLQLAATMRCDSARYLSQKRIWRLDGNVVMVNTQRDSFLTQQVFWDQMKREVYSDSFVHIVRSDRIIEGYGFSSNEQITAYTVNRPTGIFPVERAAKPAAAPDTVQNTPDSLSAPARRRRAVSRRPASATPASTPTAITPANQ